MPQEQLRTFFNSRPFGCHFNLYVNIVTVLSNVPNMGDQIKEALLQGVPYVADNMGKMPLQHARNINDHGDMSTLAYHLSSGINKVTRSDLINLIEMYDGSSDGAKNFVFQEAYLTPFAKSLVDPILQGVIKSPIIQTNSCYVTYDNIEQCMTVHKQTNENTRRVACRTLKVQLNL